MIYIPCYDCLYSIDGRRIDESCLKRPGLLIPSSIKVPRQLKEISEKFLFGGVLYRGYGHLLTDSINRLWYAAIVQQLPIIYFYLRERWEPKRTYIDIFFESASLDENRFVSFASPVLLKEVIIPSESFIAGNEGFKIHKLIPETLAMNLFSKINNNTRTEQPLYFSRTGLSSNLRQIKYEEKLEEKLKDKGFKICSPEKLTLEEQKIIKTMSKIFLTKWLFSTIVAISLPGCVSIISADNNSSLPISNPNLQVSSAYLVKPDILALRIETGKTIYTEPTAYEQQPGDKIEKDKHLSWLKRQGKDIGVLVGKNRDVLRFLEKYDGDRLSYFLHFSSRINLIRRKIS